MAGKRLPWFKFYPTDWRTDTELQQASLKTRGLWIEILSVMHHQKERGKLCGKPVELARLLHCTLQEFTECISELKLRKIADFPESYGDVTVINRRMFREYKAYQRTKLRIYKKRCSPDVTGDVTPIYSRRSQKSEVRSQIITEKQDDDFSTNSDVDIPVERRPAWDIINEMFPVSLPDKFVDKLDRAGEIYGWDEITKACEYLKAQRATGQKIYSANFIINALQSGEYKIPSKDKQDKNKSRLASLNTDLSKHEEYDADVNERRLIEYKALSGAEHPFAGKIRGGE